MKATLRNIAEQIRCRKCNAVIAVNDTAFFIPRDETPTKMIDLAWHEKCHTPLLEAFDTNDTEFDYAGQTLTPELLEKLNQVYEKLGVSLDTEAIRFLLSPPKLRACTKQDLRDMARKALHYDYSRKDKDQWVMAIAKHYANLLPQIVSESGEPSYRIEGRQRDLRDSVREVLERNLLTKADTKKAQKKASTMNLKKIYFESDDLDKVQEKLEKQLGRRFAAAQEGAKAETQALCEMHLEEMIDAKNTVLREVRSAIRDAKIPQKIVLKRSDGREIDVGVQHFRFADLAALVHAGLTVLMVGPAGGGKTEAAAALSRAMELDFAPLSLGPQTTQSQLFGYYDATGNYIGTEFRRRYEGGGLILLDELDRCNERVSVTLNAAIANGRCSFPDGIVTIHESTVIVGAANTTGHGADRQYVSARQQDAALLDRFAVLEWPIDEGFEMALAHGIHAGCDEWLNLVRQVRALVKQHKMRYVVSPRASIQGAYGLAAGLDHDLMKSTILYRGWTTEDRKKIEEAL